MSYFFQSGGFDFPNNGRNELTAFGWKELARTTLGSAGDNIEVASLADKRYYMYLVDHRHTGSFSAVSMRMGNGSTDTGANYAGRYSVLGAADVGETTQTRMNCYTELTDVDYNTFHTGYVSNYTSKEKLLIDHGVGLDATGATTAPYRGQSVGKWVNTSNPLNYLTATNLSGGDFNTGSELVVLGWDPLDITIADFWEELASVTATGSSTNLSSGTFTAKKYLWVQAWHESTSAHVCNMTFNNDTTTYSYRNSDDGGADATSTSDAHIELNQSTSTGVFTNMFIVNVSANDKLVIGHSVLQSTAGAGTAPSRREFVGKYDNTAAQITEIDLDSSSGNWSNNSIIKVWGSD